MVVSRDKKKDLKYLHTLRLHLVCPFFSENPSKGRTIPGEEDFVVTQVAPGPPRSYVQLHAVIRIAGIVRR